MFTKSGYHVVVTTWENDGDNYKTTALHVPVEKVKDVVECALMFRSNGSSNVIDEKGDIYLGNKELHSYDASDDDPLVQISHHIADKIGVELMDDFEYDLVGIWNDGEYYRVVEEVSVIYVEKPHTDVTDQFMNKGETK